MRLHGVPREKYANFSVRGVFFLCVIDTSTRKITFQRKIRPLFDGSCIQRDLFEKKSKNTYAAEE